MDLNDDSRRRLVIIGGGFGALNLAAKMKLEEGIIFLNKLNPDNDMVPIFEKKIEVWDKELKKGHWSNFGCLIVFALIVAGYLLYKHL